ncbi:MAG TPA: tetratricopeptide repeat protein [Kofleriaceae bacterium]|nr:tetratricopeptide repeat protein [Kofleriaceae bacterium]
MRTRGLADRLIGPPAGRPAARLALRIVAVLVALLAGLARPAHADPRAEVAAKARAAMASYDAMDYDLARRLLNQALAIAKKAKLDKDPIVARVYLDLGIAQFAGSDPEAAKVAFLSAVQIDPKIAIEPAYKSPELVKMLDEARAAAGDTGEPGPDGVDCKAVKGLQHTIVELARPGTPQPIEALIGADLSPARVVVMYRPEGAIDFTELRMTRQDGCRYAATIPASAMHGSLVHYYIAAYDAASKVLAARGSSGTPSIMVLSVGPTRGDGEDPITGGKHPGKPGTGVASSAAPGKAPTLVFSMSGGTGFGYVTGTTEGGNKVQTCCIGASLFVLTPELDYAMSRKLAIGVAARLGIPYGANIAGHSVIAPAGFVRVRRALSASGDGVQVMGELGAGILRNTIKIDASATMMPGMDTDIVAQGPLLLGAGVGYAKHLGASVAFLANLDAIAGIAVVKKVGSAIHLNTGISADLSVGFAIGF